VRGPRRGGANSVGLSRKAILAEVDHSLRRLGTDYIDLYQIHRLDRRTPKEEMLEALHDVVKAGKVRDLGASSMWAWQFSKALHLAEAHGWTSSSACRTTVAAVDLFLSDDEIARLEEPYRPHAVAGFS
jgi:1-deoxyxylulose-5-phosphate synthase